MDTDDNDEVIMKESDKGTEKSRYICEQPKGGVSTRPISGDGWQKGCINSSESSSSVQICNHAVKAVGTLGWTEHLRSDGFMGS